MVGGLFMSFAWKLLHRPSKLGTVLLRTSLWCLTKAQNLYAILKKYVSRVDGGSHYCLYLLCLHAAWTSIMVHIAAIHQVLKTELTEQTEHPTDQGRVSSCFSFCSVLLRNKEVDLNYGILSGFTHIFLSSFFQQVWRATLGLETQQWDPNTKQAMMRTKEIAVVAVKDLQIESCSFVRQMCMDSMNLSLCLDAAACPSDL